MTLGRNTFAEQLPAIIENMPICGPCFENGYKLTFLPCNTHKQQKRRTT